MDWRKLLTRDQDTGWRDMSADMLGGATGTLHIRRVGLQVHWRVKNLVAGSTHNFYRPPTGLRATADANTYFAGEGTTGSSSFYRHADGRLARSIYAAPVTQGFWFEGSYVLPKGTPPLVDPPGEEVS